MVSNRASYEMLPIDDVELDLENPRIKKWLESYDGKITSKEISLALGAGSSIDGEGGPSYLSLKNSIKTNGGIIHPIIVNMKSDSKYIVIEGNTRTQIYREFIEEGVQGEWSKISAMVYENLSDEVIDSIRLQAHLVGTRQWDPYSKAKYLEHLYNSENLTLEQIIAFYGGNKKEVMDYIHAYQDMEKYYRPILDSDQSFDHSRFSAFVELQNTRVKEAIYTQGYDETDFSKWVHEKKLYPLNTVRKLPRILQNEKSRKVFLKKGAEEAVKLLDSPVSEISLKDASLDSLAREICKKINSMPFDDLQRLKNEQNTEEKDIICDAKDALVELCNYIFSEEE